MTSKRGAEGDVGAAGKGGPGRGNSKHRGGAGGISWTPLRISKEQEWLGQSAQGEDRAGTQGQGGEEMGWTRQGLGGHEGPCTSPGRWCIGWITVCPLLWVSVCCGGCSVALVLSNSA